MRFRSGLGHSACLGSRLVHSKYEIRPAMSMYVFSNVTPSRFISIGRPCYCPAFLSGWLFAMKRLTRTQIFLYEPLIDLPHRRSLTTPLHSHTTKHIIIKSPTTTTTIHHVPHHLSPPPPHRHPLPPHHHFHPRHLPPRPTADLSSP